MCLPRPEEELCIKEEAILTREGEAVKLSSPAAEDTTTCTNSQSEPGGEMLQPIKTRSGGGPMKICRDRHTDGTSVADLHHLEADPDQDPEPYLSLWCGSESYLSM